jgi:hypothetical protein
MPMTGLYPSTRRRMPPRTAAAGGGGFTPTDLANCELWCDASDSGSFTYSSGTIVSQWNDLSGNARHRGTITGSPSRNGTQNGLDTVTFAGDIISGSLVSAVTNNFTMILAGHHTGSNNTAKPFQNGSAGNGYCIGARSNSTNVGCLLDGVGWLSSSTADPNAPCVYTVIRASTNWSMWLSGTLTSLSHTAAPNTPTTTTFIGHSEFSGEVFEVIFYSQALSSGDRGSVESYLIDKWGI